MHNVDGVKYFKRLGLKRVVVARENSLEEIQAMVKTGVEIEAFVHGALCVSYSGQCLMSQMIGGRSANRGQCAQPCRLGYRMLLDGKTVSENSALLSCKDLCTIEHIPELIDAGITSFKIEGRMKRPAYVYAVTKAYRQAIDQKVNKHMKDTLMQLFNRDFTDGYLFSEKAITSPVYAGNRGIVLGKIMGYKHGQLTIKSFVTVNQGDGIRIGYSEDGKVLHKLYVKGKLVNQVEPNTLFEIDFQSPLKTGTTIYRTTSAQLEKEIQKEIHTLYRKININMQLEGHVGQSLCLKLSDGSHEVSVNHESIIEKAHKPMNHDRIQDQLLKLGQTIYTASSILIDVDDDCFIPMTWLNELRRDACLQLDELRMNQCVRLEQAFKPFFLNRPQSKIVIPTYLHFHTLEQLRVALPKKQDEMFFFDLTAEFEEAKTLEPELGLVIPTIANDSVFERCDKLIKKYSNLAIAVANVGAYERYTNHVSLLLPGMNLTHSESLEAFKVPAVLSVECHHERVKQLSSYGYQFVRQVYGHVENMLTKYCPVSFVNHGKKIEKCNACQNGTYTLVDRAGAHFELLFDDNCIIHVMSEKPLQLSYAGSQYLRFSIENSDKVKEICSRYRK